jgi:hypothetical protein
MTDKEYTDVEIIEILEHCCTDELSCESCPAYDAPTKDCNGVNWFDILQLVKRQKAEIEELKRQIENIELEAELKWEREVMQDDR